MKRRVHIRAVTVCDDVRREHNGKEILIGVYNGVLLFPRFPAGLRQLWIRIEYELAGAPRHNFKLRVLPEGGGKSLFDAEGESILSNPSDPAIVGVAVTPIRFEKAGKFNISFGVDGPPRRIGWFAVREQTGSNP